MACIRTVRRDTVRNVNVANDKQKKFLSYYNHLQTFFHLSHHTTLTYVPEQSIFVGRGERISPHLPTTNKGPTVTRITKKDLQNVLDRINEATDHKLEAWTKDSTGRYRANVGTYVLDWCYGGVRLSQLCNEGGGERDITMRGTKRETYERMRAFLTGLEVGARGVMS